ncbi:WYL domain-containing protein [Hoeflea sp. G2-23]|uniref:WYL domain-containing protein n=1 Tax=Hoeflea algicola TaxID=2983763 RepID=A0ABT3Z4Y6_9HYPH|nr:WYL domain-containing protein [Hoeflea algicola]MCY0146832.1 WYL domain-containing protein [Hoeflea algicola]
MSFAMAQDLLRLAQMAASRRGGVSLEGICTVFDVSHRTAQRMTEALDVAFGNVTTVDAEDRRRYWRLDARPPERLLAGLTPRDATRSEADAEAVLASLSQVMRPGSTVAPSPGVTDAVMDALRGPFRLRVIYGSVDATPRVIEPLGLLLCHRSYLVARQPSHSETILNFRRDRIHAADVLNESLVFAPSFTLESYAAKAFGVYQDPAQYGEVIWRFAPEAAVRAAEFRLHPTQVLEPQDDGSLIVRFTAAGWLEMAWHLYQWGDKVEMIAPDGLRTLDEGYQRPDFEALP